VDYADVNCPCTCISVFTITKYNIRGDYKFAEMIGQKPSIAILSLKDIPYIEVQR